MIQWVAFDLHTGDSLASLPGLLVDYPIARTIGSYETATMHLIIDGSEPINWVDVTLPGKALFACYDDDDDTLAIQWAGYVVTRARSGETSTVDLTVITAEGYLDRRFVSADLTYAMVGQNLICKRLVEAYIEDVGSVAGLPITVVYTVAGADGTAINQSYTDASNGTVYEALQGLSALHDGPEWTIEWAWRDDQTGIEATFYVGDRVGTAASGNSPTATFEMPGCLTSAVLTEDYASDKGANAVEAYSSGSGISPSGYQAGTDTTGRPRYEFRFEPEVDADTTTKLISYAQKAVANMVDGGRAVALIADRNTAPMFGRDWHLGDDVGYVIGGLADDGSDIVPSFPGGVAGTERVISVQLELDKITPVLFVDSPIS